MTGITPERLRSAATRLREVAGAATPGPWEAIPDGPGDWPVEGGGNYLCHSPDDGVRGGHDEGDATYIAMMHPPVALALADWLDDTANEVESHATYSPDALRVADAVLGGEQS